jgi:WD40 repeat protein
MDDAHEGMIWDMSWHPLGHMLVSGSNDHTTLVFILLSLSFDNSFSNVQTILDTKSTW